MLKFLIQGYKKLRNILSTPVNFLTPQKKQKVTIFHPKKGETFQKRDCLLIFPFFLSAGLLDIMFAVLENFETLQRFQAFNHQLRTLHLHCVLKFSITVDWFLWKFFFAALWFWYFFPFIIILVIAISIWKFVRPFRWLLFERLINPVIRSGSGIECFLLSNHSTDVDGPN